MQKMKRGALAIGTAIAFGVALGAAPASAAPSTRSPAVSFSDAPGITADCWTPRERTHNQHAHTGGAGQAVSHNGPYGACDSYEVPVAWVSVSCKYTNSYGNQWYYTDWGWIYANYLSFPYGGVTKTCTR
ncbi:hypothetical protein [Micromonospora cathayae]|uniref:SH3 domain-containing protein n=1 Tax=Micromonospora cathayae TaxID=3028804 RepID=A0ABY7ZTW0_9ACTN|nr:hypothetical protein [Micromonospora sp. HUAS 3]WDZ86323.1 hypothetical protein PVK37_07945 [Micromonospora sp. HUAS 3]